MSEKFAVEELAESMYDGANPTGVPWSRRDRVVQERWRDAARLRLDETADRAPAPARPAG